MRSTVQLLLRRGADPNAASCPMPVLFFAVRSGDVEMVRLLLQKDAEPGVTLPDSVCVRVCAFQLATEQRSWPGTKIIRDTATGAA